MVFANTPPFRVALISMPWSIFNRPSIQLGALKSYLERESEYRVDTFHPYLQTAKAITPELYGKIGLSGWAGEALFAPLLFTEKKDDARKLFRDCLKGQIIPLPDFDELVLAIEQLFDQFLAGLKVEQYRLAGFSLCFSQLLPSLYLAKKIKEQCADLPIVFGGSCCSGKIGESLLQHFAEIDYLVDGEGERPLLALCDFLAEKTKALPEKILSREPTPKTKEPELTFNLDDLPCPDYTDYFKEMRQHFSGQPFIPLLPIEFSRGCWWNKCTFCNLNLQWQSYRHKTGDRMVEETLKLSADYQALHFTFTDNALPPKETERFFSSIKEKGLDFNFFAEIRGIAEPRQLQLYRRAGLTTVQVGIEALSSSLLKKMVKGTRAIDNIAMMKLSSESMIRMEGNLITDFPATTDEEIAETLRNLDCVLPYLPLQAASFFLGYGSPIHARPCDFSIQKITNHPKNRRLFPKSILDTMTMLITSYQGDKGAQQQKWQPVKQKIRQWQDFHSRRTDSQQHPLSYRDGGSFLIIRQERMNGAPLLHRLQGTSRKIYLSCSHPKEIGSLLADYPKVSKVALDNFIGELCQKQLMFREENQILALAVHHSNDSMHAPCPV